MCYQRIKNIFAKVIVIQKLNIYLEEYFEYPLDPLPYDLTERKEQLKETNKESLLHELLKNVDLPERFQSDNNSLVDGMDLFKNSKSSITL